MSEFAPKPTKEEISRRLERLYGYEYRTIYPDFMGFASFGVEDQ